MKTPLFPKAGQELNTGIAPQKTAKNYVTLLGLVKSATKM